MYCEEVTIAKLGGTIDLSHFATKTEINNLFIELDKQNLVKYAQCNSVFSYTTNSYHINFLGESTFTILIDGAPTIVDPHSVYMLDINCQNR